MKTKITFLQKFFALFTFVVIFFTFIGIPNADAANQACCCGYKDIANPASADACQAALTCTSVPTKDDCNDTVQKTFTATGGRYLGAFDDIENAGNCSATTSQLKEDYCAVATEGLLANTSPGCVDQGDCSVCDFIIVFSNVARLILGITGAFALLLFIIGGFMLIISQGNQERVEKGKKILTSTVIGIVIVLGAWQTVRIVLITIIVEKDASGSSTQEQKLRNDIFKAFTDPTYNPCNDPNFGVTSG
ncbi:MAG TPA: pilin [Patescibacteria group bacterium]|nr:pilin [Patescibacteria group bacterium]